MKKIVFALPAFLLFACGGSESDTDAIEENVNEAVENAMEELENAMEEETESMNTPEVYFEVDNHAEEEILAYLDRKGWEGQKHESGLYVVIDEEGSEEKPTLMDEVTIFYQGYLLDENDTKFDGTEDAPMTYPLMGFITGWQIGIPHFGKGGKGKLIIPSGLAYGDNAVGNIPAGSTLMFEIELVDWQTATM